MLKENTSGWREVPQGSEEIEMGWNPIVQNTVMHLQTDNMNLSSSLTANQLKLTERKKKSCIQAELKMTMGHQSISQLKTNAILGCMKWDLSSSTDTTLSGILYSS